MKTVFVPTVWISDFHLHLYIYLYVCGGSVHVYVCLQLHWCIDVFQCMLMHVRIHVETSR